MGHFRITDPSAGHASSAIVQRSQNHVILARNENVIPNGHSDGTI
jgi:hypothetical protein